MYDDDHNIDDDNLDLDDDETHQDHDHDHDHQHSKTWKSQDEDDMTEDERAHSAALQDVHFGTSWTVDGSTESGNPVSWSTSYNGYYDQKTGYAVSPK